MLRDYTSTPQTVQSMIRPACFGECPRIQSPPQIGGTALADLALGLGSPGRLRVSELLPEALLESGDAASALSEFERVQGDEPNRYRTLLGAARAADQAKQDQAARRYYSKLLDIRERGMGIGPSCWRPKHT
jgi:tetratricopeptide (TPR) repeat protein